MGRLYEIPSFLRRHLTQAGYDKWLQVKARAHVTRDKRRGNAEAKVATYMKAIHKAVSLSAGRDAYTGEQLNWTLLHRYDNEESKHRGREYKALFALLRSADHVDDGMGEPDFRICAWRTNDAKSDLSLADFADLCRKVVAANQHVQRGSVQEPLC